MSANHRRLPRIPSYRLHKPTGQAVVTLDGHDNYLGKHDTPESRQKYDRIVAEWLELRSAGMPTVPAASEGSGNPRFADLTIDELILAFDQHAQTHYRAADGSSTGEADNFKDAFKQLRQFYGGGQARLFGPLALRTVREEMIGEGLARTTINARVRRIRHLFRWGASMELVPVTVCQALATVQGLQRGRTMAPEPEGMSAVPAEIVGKARPFMSPPVAALVQLQLLTGGRLGELLVMRPCNLDRSGLVWVYRPRQHKTEHKGKGRAVFLGPQAQQVLAPFLAEDLGPDDYLFSPRRWMAQKNAQRALTRKTPRQPSHALGKRRKNRPTWKLRERYSRVSYRQAIVRACRKAGVPDWTPLQLRHTAATRIRAEFGIEMARVILGHSRVETSQIYAEKDMAQAGALMGKIG